MIVKLKKKHNTVTTRDLYIHYLENQEPGEFTLDYEKWKKVIYSVHYLVSRLIITDNIILKLEYSLGYYGIEKAKGSERRRVDFNQTKKLGRTVYHSNLHTDCYYFRFAWRKKRTNMHLNTNLKFYKFTPIQDQERREIGKRGLANWVKRCATDPFIKDYDAPFKIN